VHALLTAVQRGTAFWAHAFEIEIRGEGYRAVVTPGGSNTLDQTWQFGASDIERRPRPLGTRAFRLIAIRRITRVLVSSLAIFTISVHN
jgi:hypothetical protein